MVTALDLLDKKCRHQDTGLSDAEIAEYLGAVDGWQRQEGQIVKTFAFNNYYETLAFINAIAYVIHAEDHHPILTVSYNRCTVKFETHSINVGHCRLSENDFICAAKIDAIFAQSFA